MGQWLRVQTRARCSLCGALVELVWRWFDGEATWKHDWCEACVAEKLKEAK
jgi:hypothetical protein